MQRIALCHIVNGPLLSDYLFVVNICCLYIKVEVEVLRAAIKHVTQTLSPSFLHNLSKM